MARQPSNRPIPQNGLVDPATLDVVAKPKRRRRARNLPEPSAELREWEKKAEARAYARVHPPGIILEPGGFEKEHWTAPHSDRDLWTLQLADAFGTRSRAVVTMFMAQLEALCSRDYWDDDAKQWRLDENEYSAALALVNTVKPRNEMEAALAAQMVAVHLMTMKVSAYALKHEYETRTAATAGKLARTFAMQLETLQRLRGRQKTTKQSIKVRKELHQHVHYHGSRGGQQNDSQPHGRAPAASDECAALPSPEPRGQVVPLPSRKRKTGV